MGDDRAGQELTSIPRTSSSAPPEQCLARAGVSEVRNLSAGFSRLGDHGHRLLGAGGGPAGSRCQVGQWPGGVRGLGRLPSSARRPPSRVGPRAAGVCRGQSLSADLLQERRKPAASFLSEWTEVFPVVTLSSLCVRGPKLAFS